MMQTIDQLMQSYSAYHHDPRNKLTHFIGVPLIAYALFVALGWFRFRYELNWPVTLSGGTLLWAALTLYYLKLDIALGLAQAPVTFALLYAAERTVNLPFATSAAYFGAAFVGGWVIQFIGHYFEGRRPALFDNILQVFNAPLFLTMEAFFLLGLRADMRRQIEGGASRPI